MARQRQIKSVAEKILVIDNFRECSIKPIESNGEENKHAIIVGNPHLWSTIFDLETPYALIGEAPTTSIHLNSVHTGWDYPVAATRGDFTSGAVIVCITSKNYVKGSTEDGSTIVDYGQPFSTTSSYVRDIVYFADKVVVSSPETTSIYYKNANNTGTWSSFGGTTFYSPLYEEVFGGRLYITDVDSATSDRRLIRVYDSSFTLVGTLDLGVTWNIRDIQNINNEFLFIVASRNTSSEDWYAFLWDGDPDGAPFRTIRIPGRWRGSINYGGTVYIVSNPFSDSNDNYYSYQTHLYALESFTFTLQKVFNGVKAISMSNNERHTLDTQEGYLFIPVQIVGGTYAFLVYHPQKKEVFLTGYGNQKTMVKFAGNSLFWGAVDSSNQDADYLYSQTLFGDAPTSFSGFRYESNWFVLGKRIRINSIEIYYHDKPGTYDAPSYLRLDYKDEKTGTFASNVNILTVDNSSPSNYNKVNVGLVCTKFKVEYVSNGSNTSGWLKRALIHYEVIE